MDILVVVTAIASLITSIGTIAAVLFARKTFLVDHERRKKQATIEYYNNISNIATIPLRLAIQEAVGREDYANYTPISPTNEKAWKGNPDLQEKFIYYCRNMERFAVGIHTRVFDFETFNRFSGAPTVSLYNQIRPLIKEHELTMHDSDFCNEFQILCNELDNANKELKKKTSGIALP